jgi:hypothetical protein
MARGNRKREAAAQGALAAILSIGPEFPYDRDPAADQYHRCQYHAKIIMGSS